MFVALSLIVLPVSQAVLSADGWRKVGMSDERPSVYFTEQGDIRLAVQCENARTKVQVRGFEAAQQWPQPKMEVAFGAVTRAASPNLAIIGDQTAFSFQFSISDNVLNAIREGQAIKATYQGESISFPAPAESLRTEFSDKCSALVPPGMRAG